MTQGNMQIPGPRGHFLLGSIPEIMQDRVQFLVNLRRNHGDVVRIRLGPESAVVIFHPDAIQRVLVDNQKNYTKATRTYASLSLICGNGLICSNGDFWLRQRRLMQPAFHRENIEAMEDIILSQVRDSLDHLEPFAQQGLIVNFAHEMMNYALGIVTRALFGRRVQDMDGSLGETIHFLMSDTAFRFEHPFYPPLWFPASHNRKFNAALKRLDQEVYDIIQSRRQTPTDRVDLLQMMMDAQLAAEETPGSEMQQMTDKQLRDEAVTLFLAGHETTALALSWTLYLLSGHPEVEARLREEIHTVLAGRLPTLADLPRLTYTRQVLEESLRFYPPAWLTERKAIQDDVLNGYHIPAGTTLAITQYVTHRHPDFWENPEVFDPDRFSPERSAGQHPYAYIPFGGGPRLCIGKNLALLETHLGLAALIQRYRFEMEPGWKVDWEPELSLRLKGGLPMRLTPA